MRHDNIEHRRLRPEPFTVEGDLAFVLRTFGLPENMDAIQAEDRFCSNEPLVCSITGKSCVITTWERAHGEEPRYTLKVMPVHSAKRSGVPTFGSSPVYTTGPYMGEAASEVDPWVKVGTTTIDGTLVDVANVLDVSSWPIDWARDAKAAIDLWGGVKAHEPAAANGALSPALILEGASSEVAQAGVRAFIDALNKPPTSSMDEKREALRDLRSILLDRPDDMSKEDFRRMVLNGGTVP